MKDEFEKKVREYNLEKVVIFLGSQTQEFVRGKMSLSHLFILTGREDEGMAETQGLVVQEAQAMGVPVLVSNQGGMPEGLKEGETGYVISGENPDSFVDKIIMLHDDEQLRNSMSANARHFAFSNYGSRDLVQKLITIYKSTLN